MLVFLCSRGRSVRSSDSSCELGPGLTRWPVESPPHSSPERSRSEQHVSNSSAGEGFEEVDSLRPFLPALTPGHKRSNSQSDVQTPRSTPPRTPTHAQHGKVVKSMLSCSCARSPSCGHKLCWTVTQLFELVSAADLPAHHSWANGMAAAPGDAALHIQHRGHWTGAMPRATSAQLQQHSHQLPAAAALSRSVSVTGALGPAYQLGQDVDRSLALARASSAADAGRDSVEGHFTRTQTPDPPRA